MQKARSFVNVRNLALSKISFPFLASLFASTVLTLSWNQSIRKPLHEIRNNRSLLKKIKKNEEDNVKSQ